MRWNGASRCEYDQNSMKTETITWSQFPSGGKTTVEQILMQEEINKSKRAGLWESQCGIQLWKLTIWVRSFKIEKLQQNSPDISSTWIGKLALMMDVKISKGKHISRWVDQEDLIYVRRNRIKKRAQRWKRWLVGLKELRHWVK